MRLLLLFPAVLLTATNYAQDPAVITVKAGEEMSELYQYVYRYPQFVTGKVYFIKDSARAALNYNLLDGRIEFIGDKKDTLVIADETSLVQVIIEKDSFFYNNKNYLRSIGTYGFARLFIRETLKLMDEKNIGSYGLPSSTHSIESRRTLLSLQTMTLKLNKDLTFSKETDFLFSHQGKYYPATKKNILKVLNNKQKSQAEELIATQKIDFKKEADLQKLFQQLSLIVRQ